MGIYIFSRAIRSGKTTELMHWCSLQQNIAGILMPDVNGSRKIYNLQAKKYFDAECIDTENTKEELINIGKFSFYKAAFEKSNAILQTALQQNHDWIIIDEVGKLELDKEGFYKPVAEAIEIFSNKNKNLLLVVRDSLCDEAVAFFSIKNYRVISSLDGLK